MTDEQLLRIFQHHPPTSDDVIAAHSEARTRFHALAMWVNRTMPACPEKDEALHGLDLACRAVNAGVARTQMEGDYPTLFDTPN